ncbi:MAG: glycosyltransferase family 4 protein [Bacteroidales bacterium]|nr:glycosyltransferase family 4 protein [Bacteroidales bacterium]
MENILLITPLYPIPSPDNNATDVCHSFAKEWVKCGYNVLVIHLQGVYCFAWHLLIRMFGKQIANMVGGGNFYPRPIKQTEHYVMDGVPVYRVPVYNLIPHGRFPERSVQKFTAEVLDILRQNDFTPHVITGHMLPYEFIPRINKSFGAVTCLVEHGIPKKIKKRYPDYESLINSYTLFGFRSKDLMRRYQEEICKVPRPFICYSGIPNYFLENLPDISIEYAAKNFIFVGEFIQRKYPSTLIPALCEAIPDKDFSLVFVGEGPERENIEKTALDYGVRDKVRFSGKLPRKQIMELYDRADCMIMVSKNEAFGLVYLEAMARACITVASRGEGMDGVIVDGVNGFLCNAGDASELASVIRRVRMMSPEQTEKMCIAAYDTALELTDRNAARRYAKILTNDE